MKCTVRYLSCLPFISFISLYLPIRRHRRRHRRSGSQWPPFVPVCIGCRRWPAFPRSSRRWLLAPCSWYWSIWSKWSRWLVHDQVRWVIERLEKWPIFCGGQSNFHFSAPLGSDDPDRNLSLDTKTGTSWETMSCFTLFSKLSLFLWRRFVKDYCTAGEGIAAKQNRAVGPVGTVCSAASAVPTKEWRVTDSRKTSVSILYIIREHVLVPIRYPLFEEDLFDILVYLLNRYYVQSLNLVMEW